MGRASGRGQNTATQRRADAQFGALFGDGRGRGLPPLGSLTDAELLAVAMLREADGPRVFANVIDQFAGVAAAYDPEMLRVLRSWPVENGAVYLVAGRADGLGGRAGTDTFICLKVAPDEDGDDALWLGGTNDATRETDDLDVAAELINKLLADEGAPALVSGEGLRGSLNAAARNMDEIPAALDQQPPGDPPELAALLERRRGCESEYENIRSAGVAFAYDPTTFRTLVSVNSNFAETPMRWRVVAGRADGLGPRAGAHAYISFYVTENECGEDEMLLGYETLDPEEALTELCKAYADITGHSVSGWFRTRLTAQLHDNLAA